MRSDAKPFVVGQIGGVSPALHRAQRRSLTYRPSTFQTVSRRGILRSSQRLAPPSSRKITHLRDALFSHCSLQWAQTLHGEHGGRRPAVYARVSTLEDAPEQIDEGLRYLREQV